LGALAVVAGALAVAGGAVSVLVGAALALGGGGVASDAFDTPTGSVGGFEQPQAKTRRMPMKVARMPRTYHRSGFRLQASGFVARSPRR
jgi:hypothetical protein